MQKLIAFVLGCFCLMQMDAFGASTRKSVGSQQVLNQGTKIAVASTNTLVDQECQDSYFGCMDAFCMLENVSGGRCQCSNRHDELYAKLDEILKMDEKSYAIATYGVEHIELGKAEKDVLSKTDIAVNKAIEDAKNDIVDTKKKTEKKQAAKIGSFSEWTNSFASNDDDYEEDEDEVAGFNIEGKKGDELFNAADELCFDQTPEKCGDNSDMLKLLYAQKIKSDCAAFENSLKQQKTESYAKLETAKKAVRDAALNEYNDANKYSLGECAIEFRKCMQKTAGCGDDFKGCVTLAAAENVKSTKTGGIAKQTKIKGQYSSVQIAATTLDALLAKKALCDDVTNSCVTVKDQVWDVFLHDIAPTIKVAELAAESDLRSSCMSNISECYLKACKDNMDPKDPDGSYDMCLSRPANYKAFCKIQLEPCLNATGGSYENPDASTLWQAILARLASLRVDACTEEFKMCLKDEDRCGEDYSQCIGLDNDDVTNICPEEKLTACYSEYNGNVQNVRDTLSKVAQGILLNVDNALLDACQKAVDAAMVKVCGDTENCDSLAVDNGIGSRTLKLKFCEENNGTFTNCKLNVEAITDVELGKTTRDKDLENTLHERHNFVGNIFGQIAWGSIDIDAEGNGLTGMDAYLKSIEDVANIDDETKQKIKTEVESLSTAIRNAISAIESDPKVQFCMTGRQIEGLKSDSGFTQVIGKAGNARFPNLTQVYRNVITNSALRKAKENYYVKYDELQEEYMNGIKKIAERISEIDDKNEIRDYEDQWRWSCIKLGQGDTLAQDSGRKAANKKLNKEDENDGRLVGHSTESSYNYKRSVTTTYNVDTHVCHKCVRTQQCENTKRTYCKKWADEQEICSDIMF